MNKKPKIPMPAHPRTRREALPWQQPKATDEDPEALQRVQAILNGPSYRRADNDVEFLARDGARRALTDRLSQTRAAARGARDSSNDRGFWEHAHLRAGCRAPQGGGAARISDSRPKQHTPGASAGNCRANLRQESLLRGGSRVRASRQRCESCQRHTAYRHRNRWGAGNNGGRQPGAFDVGATSVGLNISLPFEQYPNPYITPELCFSFHYFALRKLHFLLRAKALVAFPGGYGTIDELFEVLTLVQTRKIKPIPVVLVGEAYWRRAVDMDFLVDEGVIDLEDRDLFWFAETAEEIWNGLLQWHDASGEPLHVST
jgi:uncharacterized protein (TIGR00730 family)